MWLPIRCIVKSHVKCCFWPSVSRVISSSMASKSSSASNDVGFPVCIQGHSANQSTALCCILTADCFSCHLIGGGKPPAMMLGTSNTSLNRQWHQCIWLVALLPSQFITSRRWARYRCQIQPGVQCRSLFCIIPALVYGLLSRSLPLFAWTAALALTPLLPNRSRQTTCVPLPVKFPSAGEACWWPHEQPLLGPYE